VSLEHGIEHENLTLTEHHNAMATFNQPTALPTPTDDYYGCFNKIHSTTSFSSTTGTPTATSPTSPRTVSSSPNQSFQHAAFKHDQLRKPKTPLYIPAVLRPTEFHSSCGRFNSAPSTSAGLKTSGSSANVTVKSNQAGLLTPPSSAGTSFDSQDGSLAASMMAQQQQSSALMYGEDYYKSILNRIVSDEWNDDMREEVTGAPTKDHWKVC